MGHVVAILIVAALLAGFLWLTKIESRRGVRVLGRMRAGFDRKVDVLAAYLGGGNEQGSLARTLRVVFDHVVHDIVHAVLLVVRFAERTLTRFTREIRGRRAKVIAPVDRTIDSVQ